MNKNPHNTQIGRPVFWIRFFGSLIIFGLIFGLISIQFIDMIGFIPCAAAWVILSVGVSVYIARVGYEAIRNILTSFMP
jgi:hypothetical protein